MSVPVVLWAWKGGFGRDLARRQTQFQTQFQTVGTDPGQAAQLPPEIARAVLARIADLIPVLAAASGSPVARPEPVGEPRAKSPEVQNLPRE